MTFETEQLIKEVIHLKNLNNFNININQINNDNKDQEGDLKDKEVKQEDNKEVLQEVVELVS